eukprot:451422_1
MGNFNHGGVKDSVTKPNVILIVSDNSQESAENTSANKQAGDENDGDEQEGDEKGDENDGGGQQNDDNEQGDVTLEEAIVKAAEENNLTEAVDDEFVAALSSDIMKLGRGIISNEMWRLCYNQLKTEENGKYSEDVVNAIKAVRKGDSGVRHQRSFVRKKCYSLSAVQIGDESVDLLYENDKPVLSECLILPVLKVIHAEEGHVHCNVLFEKLKDKVSCEVSKKKFVEWYHKLGCRECKEIDLKVPNDVHRNYIYIRESMDRHQMDWLDVQKGFEPRIKKQMDKNECKKLFNVSNTTNGWLFCRAVTSENSKETIEKLDEAYTYGRGWPDQLDCDNGSACKSKDLLDHTKKNKCKLHRGKPAVPEHQGGVERVNKILGREWVTIVLSATPEEREQWVLKLLPILLRRYYSRKFRKYGWKTIFENVYGYTYDVKERSRVRKLKEKEGAEICHLLGIKRISKELKKFITHPLVDTQFALKNDLIRTHTQLQKWSYNDDRMSKGKEIGICAPGCVGYVKPASKKKYSRKKKVLRVHIVRHLPRQKKYLWKSEDDAKTTGTCDVTAFVPNNPNDFEPGAHSRSSSLPSLPTKENYQLDKESFFTFTVKKWRNVQELKKSLKQQYTDNDFKEKFDDVLYHFHKYCPVELNFEQSDEIIVFKAAYELVYHSMYYYWCRFLLKTYNLQITDEELRAHLLVDVDSAIHCALSKCSENVGNKLLGIVAQWKDDMKQDGSEAHVLWLSMLNDKMHICSNCMLTDGCTDHPCCINLLKLKLRTQYGLDVIELRDTEEVAVALTSAGSSVQLTTTTNVAQNANGAAFEDHIPDVIHPNWKGENQDILLIEKTIRGFNGKFYGVIFLIRKFFNQSFFTLTSSSCGVTSTFMSKWKQKYIDNKYKVFIQMMSVLQSTSQIKLTDIDTLFDDIDASDIIPFVVIIKEYMVNNNINMRNENSNPLDNVISSHLTYLFANCDDLSGVNAMVLNNPVQVIESINVGIPSIELKEVVKPLAHNLRSQGRTGSIISQVSGSAVVGTHFVELEIFLAQQAIENELNENELNENEETEENEEENEMELKENDENEQSVRGLDDEEEKYTIFINESFESQGNATYSRLAAVENQFKLMVSLENLDYTIVGCVKLINDFVETLKKMHSVTNENQSLKIGDLNGIISGSFPRWSWGELKLKRKDYKDTLESMKEAWKDNNLTYEKVAQTDAPLSQPSQFVVTEENLEQYWDVLSFGAVDAMELIMQREQFVGLSDYSTRGWQLIYENHNEQWGDVAHSWDGIVVFIYSLTQSLGRYLLSTEMTDPTTYNLMSQMQQILIPELQSKIWKYKVEEEDDDDVEPGELCIICEKGGRKQFWICSQCKNKVHVKCYKNIISKEEIWTNTKFCNECQKDTLYTYQVRLPTKLLQESD